MPTTVPLTQTLELEKVSGWSRCSVQFESCPRLTGLCSSHSEGHLCQAGQPTISIVLVETTSPATQIQPSHNMIQAFFTRVIVHKYFAFILYF